MQEGTISWPICFQPYPLQVHEAFLQLRSMAPDCNQLYEDEQPECGYVGAAARLGVGLQDVLGEGADRKRVDDDPVSSVDGLVATTFGLLKNSRASFINATSWTDSAVRGCKAGRESADGKAGAVSGKRLGCWSVPSRFVREEVHRTRLGCASSTHGGADKLPTD
jgi:hypothetical protein